MKRCFSLCVLMLIILLFSGCWDRIELEDRGIIAGTGVDITEQDTIRLTIQMVDMQKIGGGGQEGGMTGPGAVMVHTADGYTYSDALGNMSRETAQQLFHFESDVLVVGEDFARQGIGHVIDWYERSKETTGRIYLLVSRDDARTVMETQSKMNQIWAYDIANKMEFAARQSKTPLIEIHDFILAVESKTTAPVAASVEVVTNKGEKPHLSEAEREAVPHHEIMVSGTAVFRDYNLVGWLNETETRGLLWVTDQIEKGIIVLPKHRNEQMPPLVEIRHASGNIKPNISQGELVIAVEVICDGDLTLVPPGTVDVAGAQVLEQLNQRKRKVIENEVMSAVTRAQELNADIFGFGEAVRRQYPREWREIRDQWDEIFPNLEVQVIVDANIQRTGKISSPPMPGER